MLLSLFLALAEFAILAVCSMTLVAMLERHSELPSWARHLKALLSGACLEDFRLRRLNAGDASSRDPNQAG